MSRHVSNRREFLKTTAAGCAAGGMIPYVFSARAEEAAAPTSKNDRLRFGAIGMRYQGTVIAKLALPYGDVVAIADVDRAIGEKAQGEFRQQGRHLRRLPQAARSQGRRRRDDRHARPLAHEDGHRRLPRGQGRLLREAADADDRRGQGAVPRRPRDRPRRAGRHLAAERPPVPPGLRDGSPRPHRQAPQGDRRAGQERHRRPVRDREAAGRT